MELDIQLPSRHLLPFTQIQKPVFLSFEFFAEQEKSVFNKINSRLIKHLSLGVGFNVLFVMLFGKTSVGRRRTTRQDNQSQYQTKQISDVQKSGGFHTFSLPKFCGKQEYQTIPQNSIFCNPPLSKYYFILTNFQSKTST